MSAFPSGIQWDQNYQRGPGIFHDYNAPRIEPHDWERAKQVPCANDTCQAPAGCLKPVGFVVELRGMKLACLCSVCGGITELFTQTVNVFDWRFDFDARQVWWSVQKLHQLVEENRAECLDIELPLWIIDFCIEENGAHAVDDPEYALTKSDLTKPVLCVEHPTAIFEQWMNGEIVLLVEGRVSPPIVPIDGWHRLFRAHTERKTVPAIIAPRWLEMQAREKDVVFAGWRGSDDQGKPTYVEVER